ncbi:MAG TPA: hypothetical protein VF552_05425 [Allosphingosinicella sp.]|jgi:photosystem II stability/assembly factor-like uncharacterized protein
MDRRQFIAAGGSALLLGACARRQGMETAVAPALQGPLAWRKLPTVPFRGKQDDIAFGAPDVGWYGNGEGRLYRTGDGGESWGEVWHRPGTFVRALGFVDADTGILGNVGVGAFPGVTDTQPLYRTADGGRSWTPVRIEGPVPAGICAIEVQRSETIDRGELARATAIHAAGRVGGPAHYLRSDDLGRSWSSRDLSAAAGAIFDVKFTGRRTGFLAAATSPDVREASGLILRTDDGGESWRPVFRTSRAYETVWKLHFPTRQVGYGTVQSYDPDTARVQRHVAKTVDGGATWTELPLVADHRWRSFGIGFADERVGWVGGNAGGMETRDGGQSWRPVEMGRAVNKIRFVGSGPQRRAFAIGSEVHRLDLAPRAS